MIIALVLTTLLDSVPRTIFGARPEEHRAYFSLKINAEDSVEKWQELGEAWILNPDGKTVRPVHIVNNKNPAIFVINQPDSILYIEIPLLNRTITTIAGTVPVTDYYDEYVRYKSVYVEPVFEADKPLDPVEVIALCHVYHMEDNSIWVVTGDFWGDMTIINSVTKFKLLVRADIPEWIKVFEVINCCPSRY